MAIPRPTPATVVEVLRETYALLRDPAHFTAEAMARDARGNPCAPEDEQAVAFDLAGAIWRIAPGGSRQAITLRNGAHEALHKAARAIGATDYSRAQARGHAAALDVISIAGKALASPSALDLTPDERPA